MKSSFYFDHDYNSRNDLKILELRAEFGWSGYGIFWALIETFCEQGGYIKREALGGLSLGLSTDKATLLKLIEFCLKIELLQECEDGIFNNRTLEHISYRKALSDYGKQGGRGKKKGEEKSPPLAPLKPGKESKEEDSKENKSKEEKEIIYPFNSEKFKEAWEKWKRFKKDQHKFTYRSQDSEEGALRKLEGLSNHHEETAIKIIEQSIAQGWQGLFELKAEDPPKQYLTPFQMIAQG